MFTFRKKEPEPVSWVSPPARLRLRSKFIVYAQDVKSGRIMEVAMRSLFFVRQWEGLMKHRPQVAASGSPPPLTQI